MKDSDYITAAGLARKWGVSRQRIDTWRQEGRIKSILRFGRRLIRKNVKRPKAMKPGPKPKEG